MGERVRAEDKLPPNASGEEIARAHGFRVVIDSTMPKPYVGHIDPHERLIWVRTCGWYARDQFNVLHELAHNYINHLFTGVEREAAAQRGSASMFMPRTAFLNDYRDVDGDLVQLALRWPHVSKEAMVARVAELTDNNVAAAWDGGNRKWLRASPHLSLPIFYDKAANDALGEVYSGGREVVVTSFVGLVTTAWRLSSAPNRAVTLTTYRTPKVKRRRW